MNLGELADLLTRRAVAYRTRLFITTNAHMHRYRGPELSQEAIDAVLVMFINRACEPLDLALYAEDFQEAAGEGAGHE